MAGGLAGAIGTIGGAGTAHGATATTKKAVAKTTTTKKSTSRVKSSATGAVDVAWTPDKPILGWDRIPADSWPVSGSALVVEARGDAIDVRRTPSVGSAGLRFAKGRSTTGPVTFLAIRDYGEWVQVAIPVRPNGTVGWVQGKDVSRIAVPDRIVVEIASNTMFVEKDGVQTARYPVSTGTGGTPTPTGLFFLRELIVEANASGAYGPFVFGTSGYSEVLTSFDGGNGAVGIHGTNRPDAIGENVSHGCVRVTNDVIRALATQLPLGTPVEIVQRLSDLPTQRRANAVPDADPVVEAAASGAVVIDFPLEPQPLPDRRIEDVDVRDVLG